MPTTIRLSAKEGDNVDVAEDVEQVMAARNAAHGAPFPVTAARGDHKVYVDPDQVAYWHETINRRAAFQ